MQLGQSPEQWYYVDVCKASGSLDEKKTLFRPLFTSEYFFADRILFNLDHFPENSAWLLGPGPKSKKEFYSLPIIYPAAYKLQMQKPTPTPGLIKARTKSKSSFSIPMQAGNNIETVSLLMGEGRRQQKPEPMNFTVGSTLNFSYQFKTEDSFPMKIMVNGQPLLEYMVEVSE